jgi:putative ABC transport system permease protein
VRRQFLAEALSIGVIGGAVGVLLGWIGAEVLARGFGWPTIISLDTVTFAVSLSVLAGVVFGYYPARQASALDPIDSLRADS